MNLSWLSYTYVLSLSYKSNGQNWCLVEYEPPSWSVGCSLGTSTQEFDSIMHSWYLIVSGEHHVHIIVVSLESSGKAELAGRTHYKDRKKAEVCLFADSAADVDVEYRP